jgi:hypothetical protein
MQGNDKLTTVRQGKDFLQEYARDGAECPCCSRVVKVYRRKLHHPLAVTLLDIYKLTLRKRDAAKKRGIQWDKGKHRWMHCRTLDKAHIPSSREYSKLVWWGLLENREGGFWRITDAGIKFAKGKRLVPSHAVVYMGQVQDYDGDHVSINDCLGDHFSLKELLAA